MSLDLGRWQMEATVDLASADVFDDQDLAAIRVELYQREYKGSLAPCRPTDSR